MSQAGINYEFYVDVASVSNQEKQKLIELYIKIVSALKKLVANKKDDPNFEIKKKIFEEEVLKIILDNPNILFTVQHNTPENRMFGVESFKTLYSELLEYGFQELAFQCLKNDKFRHTMFNGRYPITKLVYFGGDNRSEVLLFLLDHDPSLYTQVDEDGQNLGMHCAGPNCQDLKEVLFKFLDHEEASIAQDKQGKTIGMRCVDWKIKEGIEKASSHPQAKVLCDENGQNIFDYAQERGIEIPKLTAEEVKEMYREKSKKSLR